MINHQGEKNPHFGKPHTEEAKEQIRTTQKQRFEMLQRILDEQITEEILEKCIQQALEEVLRHKTDYSEENNNVELELGSNEEEETKEDN